MTRNDASNAQTETNESADNAFEQVEESFSELDECPAVSAFTGDLPSASTRVRVDGIIVTLHDRDSSGIVVVDYPAGACIRDTAYAGGLEDAHTAVVEFTGETGADVDFDDFDALESASEGKEIVTDGGWTQPLLYVCPEDTKQYEEACYAAGVTRQGSNFVSIVHTETAVEVIEESQHAMDDGSIVFPNLDGDVYDELFIESRVDDVELEDLSCHPF